MAFAMGSLKGALPSCQPSVARASLPTYTGMACRPLQMRAEGNFMAWCMLEHGFGLLPSPLERMMLRRPPLWVNALRLDRY